MTITEFKTACSAIEQEYKAKIAAAADLAAVEELRVAALGRRQKRCLAHPAPLWAAKAR